MTEENRFKKFRRERAIMNEKIVDALNVALVVGGSIVIPHLRHAVGTLELLEDEAAL